MKMNYHGEDLDLLDFKANLIIDTGQGNIKTVLKDLKENYNLKAVNLKEPKNNIISNYEKLLLDTANLKYFNEYGGFSEDGFEYRLKINRENKLPTVWCNILANKEFGTITTQNLGGFTWFGNSRLNRLSSWSNNLIEDPPSELIYFKDIKTGEEWSLSQNVNQEMQDYIITYGFGFTKLKTVKNGITQEVEIFVPKDENVKINIIKLTNNTGENKKVKLLYYIKPVLDEDEIKSNSYIDVSKNGNVVFAKNLYKNGFLENIAFVSSSEEITAFTGKKRLVVDEGKIYFDNLDNKTGLGEEACIAIELEIELKTFETKDIALMFGATNNVLDIKDLYYKYSKIEKCYEALNKCKDYWYQFLTTIQVNTPLESMNLLLNGWTAYQTVVSRLWSRTGFYQSGGAIGFRDQLQDTLGIKYIDKNIMKNQILLHARHQFIEGDVLHWWHEETNRGIRTRFSDDLLWLCFVVYEYIEFTGDYEILDEEISYLSGVPLEEGIDEKYDEYVDSDLKEPLYNHCIRAIEKSLDFGENGLPKIGSGDWNDGLNTVGNKKRGESVWLRIFYI